MPSCDEINKPTVDDTALDCNEIISTSCVSTVIAYNFFGIGVGATLTTVITKIMDKVKNLSNKTIDLTALTTYANDTAAGVGGLIAGKPYVDTLGYLRIKL
jgi:hypothetical protein